MRSIQYKMRASVWLYPGMAGWHFMMLPKKQSEDIKKTFGALSRGWGSLPVVVTIGNTSWKTSIFPDNKAGTYFLPLKADVRKKEKIKKGDTVSFSVGIMTYSPHSPWVVRGFFCLCYSLISIIPACLPAGRKPEDAKWGLALTARFACHLSPHENLIHRFSCGVLCKAKKRPTDKPSSLF